MEEPAWIQLDGTIIPYTRSSHAESLKEFLKISGKKRFSFDTDVYVKHKKLIRVYTRQKDRTSFDIVSIPSDAQIKTIEDISYRIDGFIEISFPIRGEATRLIRVKKPEHLGNFFRCFNFKHFGIRH